MWNNFWLHSGILLVLRGRGQVHKSGCISRTQTIRIIYIEPHIMCRELAAQVFQICWLFLSDYLLFLSLLSLLPHFSLFWNLYICLFCSVSWLCLCKQKRTLADILYVPPRTLDHCVDNVPSSRCLARLNGSAHRVFALWRLIPHNHVTWAFFMWFSSYTGMTRCVNRSLFQIKLTPLRRNAGD